MDISPKIISRESKNTKLYGFISLIGLVLFIIFLAVGLRYKASAEEKHETVAFAYVMIGFSIVFAIFALTFGYYTFKTYMSYRNVKRLYENR